MAAQNGYPEIIQVLLKKGAKIDLQNKDGVTALMWAALHGHEEAVKTLLANGADPNLESNNGKTALEITKDPSITELLKAAIAE